MLFRVTEQYALWRKTSVIRLSNEGYRHPTLPGYEQERNDPTLVKFYFSGARRLFQVNSGERLRDVQDVRTCFHELTEGRVSYHDSNGY